MKKYRVPAAFAAILLSSVFAWGATNFVQKDDGSMCFRISAAFAETDSWCWSNLGVLDVAPATVAANSAATNDTVEIAFTTPVDTTGTNTHNALTIDLAIGNATGGTNAVSGLQIDAITADAQVTENAINVGTGWDLAASFGAGVTLDDGTTASPDLTFQDATNETAVLGKVDAGNLTVTTVAGDGLQVLTGNLFIGNGTPGETINGEDLYVEGISEFDGAANFDGAVDFDGTITIGTDAVSATGLELDNYVLSLDIDDGSSDTTYWVVAPHAGAITGCWTAIDGAVATADITIDLEIANVAVTGDTITIATAGSAGGDVDTSTPSAANVLTAGQALEIIVAGGGAGGTPRVHLNCLIDR